MGVYDYLKAKCPECGAKIGENNGDIQIKWFSRPGVGTCFRTFRLGDLLPEKMQDGNYAVGDHLYCCNQDRVIFAKIENNKFMGFI